MSGDCGEGVLPADEQREPKDDGAVESASGPGRRSETWALAVGFGLASVPWTYAFVTGFRLPLWPSFVAAASVFAAGGGLDGLARSAAGNLAGIVYATATLLLVGALGGGAVALSAVVGGFMFLGSLHAFVPWLRFTPATFLGYATLFGVDAAGATVSSLSGPAGAAAVATVAMLAGAAIGSAVDRSAARLA